MKVAADDESYSECKLQASAFCFHVERQNGTDEDVCVKSEDECARVHDRSVQTAKPKGDKNPYKAVEGTVTDCAEKH